MTADSIARPLAATKKGRTADYAKSADRNKNYPRPSAISAVVQTLEKLALKTSFCRFVLRMNADFGTEVSEK